MQAYSMLRHHIHLLGHFLGDTLAAADGSDILDLVEHIRVLSRDSRSGDENARQQLLDTLKHISDDHVLPVARAFSHFLNLTNIAEQYQTSLHRPDLAESGRSLEALLKRLNDAGLPRKQLQAEVDNLLIELVLTAHPTETTRRSLMSKHIEINRCLSRLDREGLPESEQLAIHNRLRQLIALIWHTEEIRSQRPTPIDEAKNSFVTIESSLWKAVPRFYRQFRRQLKALCGLSYPMNKTPIKISSWIGGDRDGNPFVTAKLTRQVLYLARLKAAELFLEDIRKLTDELSISQASPEFCEKYGQHAEPYRAVLKPLRSRLINTVSHYQDLLAGQAKRFAEHDLLLKNEELWSALHDCHQSLCACGMEMIADGLLLDTLCRVNTFGLGLLQLDVRQESGRHRKALSELTLYLGLGDYETWCEAEKQAFLSRELDSRRPLLPRDWQPSAETQEVLDTFAVIAEQEAGTISAYIISMAQQASDVLAVQLLLKEALCAHTVPVAPLFETLDDLNRAESVIHALLHNPTYQKHAQRKQMVMIGYSDSAKDAGMLAAGWAQYRAQESLIALCEQAGVELILFHGRGGTIGRGGAPAHAALLSQPPRSLKNGLRVTEQGEMIRFKLGLPAIAVQSFDLYASAILEANLLPPPAPKQAWRDLMDKAAEQSCTAYRAIVRQNPDFVPYFRAATPEQELARLPLGSRPAKRNPTGGVESLRAIPWIFAWMQNRLMLPAWLGAGQALESLIQDGDKALLTEMCQEWPFFSTRIGMLEMVFSKVDLWLAEHYDQQLVPSALHSLGQQLREQLQKDIETVLHLAHDGHQLMSDLPWIAQSIALRNIYTDPLNLLQVELLKRLRHENPNPECEMALLVTITGIAAGMRNTG